MFGLIGMVLALVIVALLARRQSAALLAPADAPPSASTIAVPPGASERERSLQIQQQVRRSLESATQPRAVPDEP